MQISSGSSSCWFVLLSGRVLLGFRRCSGARRLKSDWRLTIWSWWASLRFTCLRPKGASVADPTAVRWRAASAREWWTWPGFPLWRCLGSGCSRLSRTGSNGSRD